MDKNLKSLLTSLGLILLYYYATVGIVKLIWNTDDDYKFEGRVKFLVLLSILFSIIYIFGIYYIVGIHYVNSFYKFFIVAQLIYVGLGVILNALIKR
jgi:hypothetical protein